MRNIWTHKILIYFIGLVWLVNGLLCKVLNLVPRHEQIVARILGGRYSRSLTLAIGVSEIGMAVWTISKIKSRYNAMLQMAIVAAMNLLEFFLVPDLLLWGRVNAVFAFFFILLIYFTEFKVNPSQT
ncbi:DoxX-like family protein [Chitinophaga filiformis]|uniref:DoxX-like family protein n=1 Tax=Chitinophaga filiformis TaxID=104663 RepID=UPI001F1FFEF2|nr:DoxX-like family protein [Chitinophaga filiformis]MCF6407248.1 DoxX-like family protein [Chitinophaga filiformis]